MSRLNQDLPAFLPLQSEREVYALLTIMLLPNHQEKVE